MKKEYSIKIDNNHKCGQDSNKEWQISGLLQLSVSFVAFYLHSFFEINK